MTSASFQTSKSGTLSPESPSLALRARAELERRRRERTKESVENIETTDDHFGDWLKRRSPHLNWNWPHLLYIRQKLARVTSGDCRRIIFNLPPQHGKSQQITIRYPIYRLEMNPRLKVGIAAYSQFLANKFSRSARRLARECLDLDRDRTAVEEWETTEGGGLRAVGRGGGISGQPFDLFIIDDPIKGRKEAESGAIAEELKGWYFDEVDPRAAQIIGIWTRWGGLADPTTVIVEEGEDASGEKWEIHNLPALAEENDPLGREKGEALCPERRTREWLEARRNNPNFDALYQGSPLPKGGLMFREDMFPIVETTPLQAEARIRYWDKAGSANEDAARTSGTLLSYAKGLFWLEDNVAGFWAENERENTILATAKQDRALYGEGIQIWVECEPGYTGEESARRTIRNLAGFDAHFERVTGDKVERARHYAAQCQAKNVRMKRGDWNKEFVKEHSLFPRWKWKDRVDSSSGAFNKCAEFSEGIFL